MTMINDRNALATIRAIESLPDDDSDISITIRALLINFDDADPDLPAPDFAPLLTTAIRALDRQSLSMLALDYSLCPLHLIDYAICFDDDDPECATIRDLFPDHDT